MLALCTAARRASLVGRSFNSTPVAMAAGGADGPIKTALYDLHVELGGKMVEFAGYWLPVQYKDGVVQSHTHTRTEGCCSLFDVSHMGQLSWTGADRAAFLERVTVADMQALKKGTSTLSVITNDEGGILDDTVMTNAGDWVYMVINGATKHDDIAHLKREMDAFGGDVQLEHMEDRSLLALQGPAAMDVLGTLCDAPLPEMAFMTSTPTPVAGVDGCIVTRCGYTGEDGFEVSVPSTHAEQVARALLGHDAVLPAGLAARDSLRLEAGLCLYGTDLDPSVSPVEAGLRFTISKRRREEGGFNGADRILGEVRARHGSPTAGTHHSRHLFGQLKDGVSRRRVGLTVSGAPAREGTHIYKAPLPAGASEEEMEAFRRENHVGTVTSGTRSPLLKENISQAYIRKGFTKAGRTLYADVRGKSREAVVTKMPFVPTKYYSPN